MDVDELDIDGCLDASEDAPPMISAYFAALDDLTRVADTMRFLLEPHGAWLPSSASDSLSEPDSDLDYATQAMVLQSPTRSPATPLARYDAAASSASLAAASPPSSASPSSPPQHHYHHHQQQQQLLQHHHHQHHAQHQQLQHHHLASIFLSSSFPFNNRSRSNSSNSNLSDHAPPVRPLSERTYQVLEGTSVLTAVQSLIQARRELEREIASAQRWFMFLQEHHLDDHALRLGFFGFLPDELTLHIFSFLPANALLTCTAVCKRWSLLASDDTLWKALSLSRWPQVQDLFRTTTKSWRWIYKSKGNQFKPTETPHGCGSFMQPNGNIYYGEWRYGERHGWGVSVMSNGRVYEGGFQHDKRNGWGMFRWPGGQNSGGDTYIGEWKDSKRHGYGVYTWADGRAYEGQWENDKRAGGKSTYPDGHVYEGQYCKGKRHGRGKTIYPDGSIYEGGYRNNKRHGHGTFIWSDGDQFSGEWKSGRRCGFGVYIRRDTQTRVNQYWEEVTFDMNDKGTFGVLNPSSASSASPSSSGGSAGATSPLERRPNKAVSGSSSPTTPAATAAAAPAPGSNASSASTAAGWRASSDDPSSGSSGGARE